MRLATFALVLIGSALAPALASAQASVQFRLTDSVGRPVDGRVAMAGQPGSLSCATTASRCTIVAPAGSYTVTVTPARESAPAPRTVIVPPSGAVSVALTMRSATATALVGSPGIRTGVVATPTSTPTSTAVRIVTPSGGGTTTTTTTPTATATPVATATATPINTGVVFTGGGGRPLGTGRTLSVQGSVMDGAGRPVDATITVRSGAGVVGTVSSTAGRFSMYDLAPGVYTFSSVSTRRTSASMTVTIGAGTVSRVTVRVP